MPNSPAHLCSREEAVEVFAKLKLDGKLNPDLKPMPYEQFIAFPVWEAELILEFETVVRSDPHLRLGSILDEPPKKWEILGDLVIFPEGTNVTGWPLAEVAEALGCKRVAIQAEIDSGQMRKSRMELVHGEDGWVIHRENFIDYEFDATKVMFSSGNVTERRRMGEIDCKDEIIVDAFAGIGYYTLPFLVRGKAGHVHVCEMNPDSIAALEKGLARNGVTNRCTIHPGDNRQTLPKLRGIADRVNLGLIPSSMSAWASAIRCLKPSGGMIHVHMNVHEDEIEDWCEKTVEWFATGSGKHATATHLEKVKWYCPHIRHVVLDIKISN